MPEAEKPKSQEIKSETGKEEAPDVSLTKKTGQELLQKKETVSERQEIEKKTERLIEKIANMMKPKNLKEILSNFEISTTGGHPLYEDVYVKEGGKKRLDSKALDKKISSGINYRDVEPVDYKVSSIDIQTADSPEKRLALMIKMNDLLNSKNFYMGAKSLELGSNLNNMAYLVETTYLIKTQKEQEKKQLRLILNKDREILGFYLTDIK